VTGHRSFESRPGPVFRQLALADEINRATPKSQSALLEAMQERSVTVAGTTHILKEPFLVMATQNPIEQEGTYALPEAQLDRFLFKIIVPFTTRSEMNTIVGQTTGIDVSALRPVMDGPYIQQAQRLVRRIVVAPHVQSYIIRLAMATHPGSGVGDPKMDRYIRIGASPRGAQALIRSAKVRALMRGRYAVAFGDIAAVAGPALRHRLLRSFEAEADAVTTDDIVKRQLEFVPREAEEEAAAHA
jgi:MoxR-like ATPase